MSNTAGGSLSLTLSRGIEMLELVCAADVAPSIGQVAQQLGVHRSAAYRLLRTLEAHYLLRRDEAGRIYPAAGLTNLARGVENSLQTVGLPVMTKIADELGMSCFIAVAQGADCFTLVTVEATTSHALTQHPGTRHHLDRGAPGVALLSGLTPQQRTEIEGLELSDKAQTDLQRALQDGYASSFDEVIPGVSSVAVPLMAAGQLPAALAVVYPRQQLDEARIARTLHRGVDTIVARLGRPDAVRAADRK